MTLRWPLPWRPFFSPPHSFYSILTSTSTIAAPRGKKSRFPISTPVPRSGCASGARPSRNPHYDTRNAPLHQPLSSCIISAGLGRYFLGFCGFSYMQATYGIPYVLAWEEEREIRLVDIVAADREMRCSYNRASITSYNLASRPRRGECATQHQRQACLPSSTMKLGTATRVVFSRYFTAKAAVPI
jgi:hypothetical protein